jgi:hypothetical protein
VTDRRYRVFVQNRELGRPLQLDELHVTTRDVARNEVIELVDGRRVIVDEVVQPTGERPGRIAGRPFLS